MAKILVLDIETTPNIAYVWRLFKENVGADQVVKNSEILSYAAKWLGEDEVFYNDTFIYNERYLIRNLIALLDEADVVVAHYGKKFDLPKINARAMVHGFAPPSPYKVVDTKEVASKKFNFEANNLKHLANVLGCEAKDDHKNFPGFKLWLECLRGNPEAYKELKIYNIQDVITLEEIYLKMLPWIDNHPNVAVYNDKDEIACPKCGSKDSQKRGFYFTNVFKYQRYQCKKCGGWHRARFNEGPKKKVVVNAG